MSHKDDPALPSAGLQERWSSYGAGHVPYRLLMLAKMLDRVSSVSIVRGGGLTLAEWRVVANLARVGESTVGTVADYSMVDRAEVSRAAVSLEARGLITRGAHPASRAKKLLQLTSAGRSLAQELNRQRRAFYAYLLEGLDEESRRRFDDLLLHIAVRVEQYDALLDEEDDPAVPS